MAKDDFKRFVRSHPDLIQYVNDGSMSWQKFYEMYDIYGENSNVWDKYNNMRTSTETITDTNTSKSKLSTVGDTS